jgi:hypothetical protein
MAKVTKQVIKDIVKECLLEILVEGIAPDSKLNERKLAKKRTSAPRKQMPDVSQLRRQNADRIKTMSSQITSNPMLAEMFQETAASISEEQLQSMNSGAATMSAAGGTNELMRESKQAVDTGVDPNQLAAAANWATLAFQE